MMTTSINGACHGENYCRNGARHSAKCNAAKAGGHSVAKRTTNGKVRPKTLKVLAATSRKDAACSILHEIFDESLVVPQLTDKRSVEKLIEDSSFLHDKHRLLMLSS